MRYPILLYRGELFNANCYYFAKCDIDHTFLLLEEKHKTIFVPKMNESIARELFDGKIIVYDNWLKTLKEHLKKRSVFVDSSSISASFFQKLAAFCKPKNIGEKLAVKRATKNEQELKKIKNAVKITKDIFHSIDFSRMKTEQDVKKFLLKETLGRNLEQAFEPIVATDKNSSFPHYKSGNIKLGDSLLIDYGIKYENYCSDLTRCFFLNNSKKNKERKEKYDMLIDITKKIVNHMKKFKIGKEIAKYSAELLQEYNLPKLIHSIGHGVGLEVHEMPSLGKKSKDKIARSVLAIEPAVYFKEYGLRYEENIYFNGKTAKIL